MKRNLKLLSAILLIILSSCQEENIYQQEQPKNLKVKEITFSNAKEIKLLDNTLIKMFESIKSHKSTNKNTAPVEDNDFTIDQSVNVKVMSDGNSTTYTMLIKRAIESPEYFENLVIKIANDSQPKAYIFKYTPSEASHYVVVHNEFSFKDNFEVHEILYNSSVFQPLVNLSGCGKVALCDYGGTTHNAGDNCTEVYYVLGNCDANTPDNGGGGYPPYTAPVGGGGAALQGNVLKMNGFITNLSFPKQDLFATFPQGAQDAIFNYFVANNFANGSTAKVSAFLQSMISNNLASYFTEDLSAVTIDPNREASVNSILNYLISNNFSSQSTAFVNQMISAAITNNSTFTFNSSLNATNGISFNTVSDAQNYLNNPAPQTTPTSTSMIQGNERLISNKFAVSILINLDVNIKQLTASPFTVTDVTSDYSGVTFGNTWNQQSYSTSMGNNQTRITVMGTRTTAIFINGIGVVSVKHKQYQITINSTTGTLITFFQIH